MSAVTSFGVLGVNSIFSRTFSLGTIVEKGNRSLRNDSGIDLLFRKTAHASKKIRKMSDIFKELCHTTRKNKELRGKDLEPFTLSRNRFFKFTLKCFALTAVSLKGIGTSLALFTRNLRGRISQFQVFARGLPARLSHCQF